MAILQDWSAVSGSTWPTGWIPVDAVDVAMDAGNIQAGAGGSITDRLALDGNTSWTTDSIVSPDYSSDIAADKDFIEFTYKPGAINNDMLIDIGADTTPSITTEFIAFHLDSNENMNSRIVSTSEPFAAYDASSTYTLRFYRLSTGGTDVICLTVKGGELTQETPVHSYEFNFSGALHLRFVQNANLASPSEVTNILKFNSDDSGVTSIFSAAAVAGQAWYSGLVGAAGLGALSAFDAAKNLVV